MTHYASAVAATAAGSSSGAPVWVRMLVLVLLLMTWGLLAVPKYRARIGWAQILNQSIWTIVYLGVVLGNAWVWYFCTTLAFPVSILLLFLGTRIDRAAVIRTFVSKEPPVDVRGHAGSGDVTDIVLTDAGSMRVQVVRELRRMYGVGLQEAVSATGSTPITLREHVSMEEAST